MELDSKQKRAIEERLSENELVLFDLLKKDELAKAESDCIKLASRDLLESIKSRLSEIERSWETEQTKAGVNMFNIDELHTSLAMPPYTVTVWQVIVANIYTHISQQAVAGKLASGA